MITPLFRFMLTVLLVTGIAGSAQALPRIDITKGNFTPMPIAIPDGTGNDAEAVRYGRDIFGVVAADLERSGLFRPIDKGAHIERIVYGMTLPKFSDWRQINAQALVTGEVENQGGRLKVSFRLWDVYGEKQIIGKEFTTLPANWRRIAHLIADEIYKRLTGEDGYFDSRIVYVAESGPKTNRIKRLAIMDQDGENHKFLTDGSHMVLTPRFSPNSQEIIYFAYRGRKEPPRVFLRDLQTGREVLVGQFEGMSFAPRFSPGGDRVIMSIAKDGVTNIHEMNLRTRQMRQVTRGGAIDTSPSYSPDGKEIVFNSDRGGSQQLYIMDASGANVRRISYGDGRYATPAWSPRGDLIAYTKMNKGTFYIGVMRPDGSGDRVLTDGFLVEGPTWSPNGRVILFARQDRGGRTRLYSIDVTGYNERQLITPMDASDPAWSPLLPL